jgi:predicted membrane-bound mannosyltransferase
LATAAFVFWLWNLRGKSLAGLWRAKAVLAAVAVFLLLSVMLFTWFGSNWKALPDLLYAAPHLLARASGEGHQKPFWYYSELLTGGWSGGLICALASVGFIQTVRKRDPSPYGFLAFYALFLAVIYSLIPYKTPWLALNFWLPIALFAGLVIKSLWRMPAKFPALRVAIPAFCVLVGGVAAGLIAHDTHQRVFVHPADETNPYAYAQTSEDLLGLPAMIELVAHQNAIASPRIAVMASDAWPLPWYLRHFSEVGFWQPGQQVGQADFYITSPEAADQYSDQLKDSHPDFFGVRPGVLILLWSPAPK